MKKISIIGGSGYSGQELIRLLLKHPKVEISHVYSRKLGGEDISIINGNFFGSGIKFEKLPANIENSDILNSDLVFLALPTEVSIEYGALCYNAGLKVIDLSGAYRIKNPNRFKEWYKLDNPNTEILNYAIYGLSEIYKESISKTTYVANPGCYPTSILIPLIPLYREQNYLGFSIKKNIICDVKSGVSGKGRSLNISALYYEANENVYAYKIGVHQHTPEVEDYSGTRVLFVPHVVPLNRGIISTIYIPANLSKNDIKRIENLYSIFYEKMEFVNFRGRDVFPQIKDTAWTNRCDFGFTYNSKSQYIIITSVIDNLLKGAAGQAVQNMNIIFGFDENTGLI